MSRSQRVFLGLVAGVLAGLVLPRMAPDQVEWVAAVAAPVGSLWLHALQMTVVPLVTSLLIVGVAQAADLAAGGRIARVALGWILLLTALSAIVTAFLAPWLLSFCPRAANLTLIADGSVPPPMPSLASPVDHFTALIPTNAVAAAAQGAIAPLVVFTLCFAFALTRIAPSRRAPVVALAHGVADAMTVLVEWVLAAAPIGVFALILPVAMRAGAGILGALGVYVGVVIAVYLVVTAAVYAVACCGGGEHLARFASAILPAQAVAAGTQSSLASMPAMLAASNRLDVPPHVSGLVLPLTVSLFRLTSPAQYVTVASFIAWSQGVSPDPWAFGVATLLAIVISLGSVGLPGQASFMGTNLPVVQAAGLPVEPLGLLLAVDLIPDVFATIGNVTADLAVICRVAPRPQSPRT